MDLTANFIISSQIGNAPLEVSFTNTSQGPFVRVEWDFGDGTKSTEINPVHVYEQDGNFTAVLRVFATDGARSETTRIITVLATAPGADTNTAIQQALFTYKRFEPGQVSVKRVTTTGSTWETKLVTDDGAGGDVIINGDISTVAIFLSGSSFTGGTTIRYLGGDSDLRDLLGRADDLVLAVVWSYTGAGTADISALNNYSFQATYGDRFSPNPSAESVPILFYKVVSVDTGNTIITVDRKLPTIDNPDLDWLMFGYLPHLCGSTRWYGEAVGTGNTSVGSKIGIDSSEQFFFPGIDFNTYDTAREVRGFASYVGYTGTSGATYAAIYPWIDGAEDANRFYPGSVYLYNPWVLWHDSNTPGLEMWDSADQTQRDEQTGLRFRYLRAGQTQNDPIVGQVFHDKNLVLITDPELASALVWVNDRSWTLPAPTVKHIALGGQWVSGGTGNLAPTGCSWYFTYRIVERDPATGSWPTSGRGSDYLGYTEELAGLPCQYVQRVNIPSGETGIGYFNITIPKLNQATGGTQCVANDIQGFVASWVEILAATGTTDSTGPDMDSWRIMTGVPAEAAWTGNFGTNVTITIDNNSSFRYDTSGETYSWAATNITGSSDLHVGSEPVQLVYMSGNYASDIYKMSAVCVARNNEFNNTQNMTFDEVNNEFVYITEVGLYNETNELLMVGKLSRPVKKNNQKFVTVKLELDL